MFAILFDTPSATFSYAINNCGAYIFVPIHALKLCLNDRSYVFQVRRPLGKIFILHYSPQRKIT
jgi:hypothetical protein